MSASAVADPRGLKRVCVGCGIRFYDLNKRPISCPNCQTEFSSEIKLKARRGRGALLEASGPAEVANDDNTEQVEVNENEVSLEDLDESANDADGDDEAMDLGDNDAEDEDEDIDVEVDDKE